MPQSDPRNEFIRMVEIGATKDYVWSNFVDGWRENDWPEQSAEAKAQVTSWVKQYREGYRDVRDHGESKEVVEKYKSLLRNILQVLVQGKPAVTRMVDVDIPF